MSMRILDRLTGDEKNAKEGKIDALVRRLHRQIVDRIDVTAVMEMEDDELRERLRDTVERLLESEGVNLNPTEREEVTQGLIDEIAGLGPLEALMADPAVSDILVNGPTTIYIERGGRLERVEARFRDDEHLINIIGRIVGRVGRRVDESSPMVDARLADGSRVNAIIPPLALDGPALSIRRFGSNPLTHQDLVSKGALTQDMMNYLEAAVRSKCNVLISGGTGAGKTTLLNALSNFVPPTERVITLEDSAELRLQLPHCVRLESRPPNIEGRGGVTIGDLMKNALRMRPDRIIVGEVRGGEALDMLQAMNTGHEGSMGTVHANTPADALQRLTTMITMRGVELGADATARIAGRALNVIVQAARLPDGTRRITSISEITAEQGAEVTTREIFVFERQGVLEDGTVIGEHLYVRESSLLEKFYRAGAMQRPEA